MIGRGKETKMRLAHEAAGEGTTLVGPPVPSRHGAGPLSGAAHLDDFVPLLVDLYGEGWCAGGNLSVLFKGAAQAGEMLHVEATPGRERARLEMRSAAMALICQGTGADHADAGSELSRRLLTQEAAPRSAIRILTGLSIGAEVHDLTLSQPGAASGAALSPSEVVELAAAACAPAIGDDLARQGQLGGVEIQFLQGPLRQGAAYVGRTRLHAITESPEAEAAWFDVLIADPKTGKDHARVTFWLRFMKAASPLWA
jgi:hypothetical protein|tara:strand:+ start:21930 stop:22697 length:768 start_codon:yes stop_codon:yes gene_type:complete